MFEFPGISCYSRSLDYSKFRVIADDVGAYLMADMAHVSGLVAAGLAPSPFPYCDIVCFKLCILPSCSWFLEKIYPLCAGNI